jgi:hypothetical protein
MQYIESLVRTFSYLLEPKDYSQLNITGFDKVPLIVNVLKNIQELKVLRVEPTIEKFEKGNFCVQIDLIILVKSNDQIYSIEITNNDKINFIIFNIEIKDKIDFDIPIDISNSCYFGFYSFKRDKSEFMDNLVKSSISDFDDNIDNIKNQIDNLYDLDSEEIENIQVADNIIDYDNYINPSTGGFNLQMNIKMESTINVVNEETNIFNYLGIKNIIGVSKLMSRCRYDYTYEEYLFEKENSYIYYEFDDNNMTCAGNHIRIKIKEFPKNKLSKLRSCGLFFRISKKLAPEFDAKNYEYVLSFIKICKIYQGFKI